MISRAGLMTMAVIGGVWCIGCDKESAPPPPVAAEAPVKSPLASVAATAPVAPAAPAAPAAEAGPIPWAVPAGWERVPGERPMRVATFKRENDEIAVSQFPGEVGGVLANVNRWRAQVGLGPITDAELPKETTPFDNGKLKGYLMRLKGEKQHMLAAIISEPAANRTWFVKATVAPESANTLKSSVNAFAQSFGTGKY